MDPGGDGARSVGLCHANAEEFSDSCGACAPIGWSAVAGDEQVAIGCDALVDGEHLQAGDQLGGGNVTGWGGNELSFPDFAAGFSGDEGLVLPVGGSEHGAAVDGFVEDHTAGGLVLGAEVHG